MKNFYLLLVVLLISSNLLFSQDQGISIGGNVYFPVGDWAEIANTGFAGSVTYEIGLDRDIMGVLYSGYTYFGASTEGVDWTMIPLVGGAKFYLSHKHDWYIAALLGVNFVSANTTVKNQEFSRTSTEFAGNANFGYEIATSEKGAVDISAGFVYMADFSYFGTRLAYIFKF